MLALQPAELDALLKEFEIRWQEILAIQNSLSSWSITYVTALFVTIAWVLGRRGSERLVEMFKADHDGAAVLILTIAAVNALYLFGATTMTYRMHELALYVESTLAPEIRAHGSNAFNQWEHWRRANPGAWMRHVFGVMQFALPVLLSMAIFVLYLKHGLTRDSRFSFTAIYAYLTFLFTVVCITGSLLMSFHAYSAWSNVITDDNASDGRRQRAITPADSAPEKTAPPSRPASPAPR